MLLVLAALCARASAAQFASLDKMRNWPVYDDRAEGEAGFADLCRMARLPCGAVVVAGRPPASPSGPVAGQTVGAILDRIVAANPGYSVKAEDGVLRLSRDGDLCAAALERPGKDVRTPVVSARAAALMSLRELGWRDLANAALASLSGDAEDARFLRVEVVSRRGASARRILDAVAQADGRMFWLARSDGRACVGFEFRGWRKPRPLEGSSRLVSVTGPGKIP